MKNVKIIGWNKGFNKVQFTLLLRGQVGYSLSAAKHIVDEILSGSVVNVEIEESYFFEFIEKAKQLGVVVQADDSKGNLITTYPVK